MILIRPPISKGSHPVENGSYLLATPAIADLCVLIKQWLDSGATGAMIDGSQRFGKSRGIIYAMADVKDEYSKSFPVLYFNCRKYRTPSEGVFFEDFLYAMGHGIPKSGGISAKRNRVTEYLCQLAIDSGHRRILLFVDEAQNLHEDHYKWLVDIYNELDRRGVRMLVILVGQPELLHQRAAFQKAHKNQIVGRFMVHHFHFSGLCGPDDVRYCLQGYDETEYPEGSGWSFTRFFFPAAFDAHWRLTSTAEVLWESFQQIRAECKLPGTSELPMQYFTATVEYALRHFGSLDFDEEERIISRNQWKEAIKHSGYQDAGRYI